MNMMVNKTEYTSQQVKEIKMLVEVHGADCQQRDNEGRNVLHHLASPSLTKTNNKDLTGQWNIINHLTDFFFKKGVSVNDQDTDGNVPVVFALSTFVDVEDRKHLNHLIKQKNLKLVSLLLEQNKESLIHCEGSGKEQTEKMITKIVEAFVGSIELCNVAEDLEVFKTVIELIKLLLRDKVIEDTKFLDKAEPDGLRSGCLTIFELLCKTFTTKSQ